MDHCDPDTLPALAKALPLARFIGPTTVVIQLLEWGIEESRFRLAEEQWCEVAQNLRLLAVPAAHHEIQHDEDGRLEAIGYLLDFVGGSKYILRVIHLFVNKLSMFYM
jgi:L-ascorbate 6-phosphate lactonase